MAKSALITGITGQDGAYLAKHLLDKGYKVYGTFRRLSTPNFWRLQHLDIIEQVQLIPAEMVDAASMMEAITISEPQEVYHLAAQSHVGASFEQPIGTAEITGLSVTRILEAIRSIDPKIRFYQASTSELYGNAAEIQNEETPFHPASPYAAAKLYGYWACRIYREAYGLYATNGILFNHESPLRGLEFVTRKITNAVAQIKCGILKELRIGNLQAKRDWGFAPEYVDSMWLMLQQEKPGDFVIASGETHSVQEFVEHAFAFAELDWKKYVRVDKTFLRPLDVMNLQGDCSKAQKELGWKPKMKFEQLVEIMVDSDVARWERHLRGEKFAWDAPNYQNNMTVLSRSLRI